jgi:hypothetical protein
MEDPITSETFLRMTAVGRACVRYARDAGLSDRQIVDGFVAGTLLDTIRRAEDDPGPQLVLSGVIGPAWEVR